MPAPTYDPDETTGSRTCSMHSLPGSTPTGPPSSDRLEGQRRSRPGRGGQHRAVTYPDEVRRHDRFRRLSQLSALAFADPEFTRIVATLRALAGRTHPLELAENGLGYNNLLYMAVLLSRARGLAVAVDPIRQADHSPWAATLPVSARWVAVRSPQGREVPLLVGQGSGDAVCPTSWARVWRSSSTPVLVYEHAATRFPSSASRATRTAAVRVFPLPPGHAARYRSRSISTAGSWCSLTRGPEDAGGCRGSRGRADRMGSTRSGSGTGGACR